MLFNSLAFLIFFPTVFILYWSIPNNKIKTQNVLLLIASYVFYGWWDWRFLSLIAFSTVVDYFVGLQIANAKNNRKRWLLVSVFVNLGLLATFKYFNFFIESWIELWSLIGLETHVGTLNIVLPVGISFYTFQTMSYSIDIYRKELQPTKDFIAFSTFVSFFPQLVAGPIERASNLIPQLLTKREWKHENFKNGFFQICIGFFRKVVVADSIGALIDGVYNEPGIHNSTTIGLAVFLYSFQIYFDFSGYSDIAIGTAKLLGFQFKRNFNLPYFSTSITEFWRRWHISLSSWLRDYLYIPLGGNRNGTVMLYRNLFLTMLLGGLWHGSSWNFVIWGMFHGILLAIERGFGLIPKKYNLFNNLLTFFLVTLIWVFFRALDFGDTKIIFQKLFTGPYRELYIGDIGLLVSTFYGLTLALLFDLYLFRKGLFLEDLGNRIKNVAFVFAISFIVLNIILFYSSASNFIYFQF
ncbi:MBOAT family O-acyltransferase [Flagellimonas halotolerans]|uniref:MBOAT family O-acyltransferase n=1 Tax=Flagellimonas halotolerans TaxID=3112164 RepID=A0ABU6IT37_9FLAO|nr:MULTISPECIES: MBOAT family O-acyltransferase [unclassified Allomuricauda]MEC3966165.1 MBOAT family O-acyltransferase [Muricauda sp. SYSU M86414]MEC4266030.1 MBOAT family O-acyltransferase [Muricauda sp. SYSU M84420]